MADNTNILTNEYNPFNKMKVLCWYERMEAIKTGNFMAPVNIALDIIQGTQDKKKCGDFNCNFCMSNWEDKGVPATIPEDILYQIPEFYNRWGVRSICLAGHHSDPVMYNHKALIKFLRLCNRFNVEVGLVTNGAFLTRHLMEDLARACNWVGFSINAGTAAEHEKITGSKPGTFDKIISNIKDLFYNYSNR